MAPVELHTALSPNVPYNNAKLSGSCTAGMRSLIPPPPHSCCQTVNNHQRCTDDIRSFIDDEDYEDVEIEEEEEEDDEEDDDDGGVINSVTSVDYDDDVADESCIITVDNVTNVVPATSTDDDDDGSAAMMFLSCCDLVCRSYPYINRIFFYPGNTNNSFAEAYESMVSNIREGLARVLVKFYPLAGRFTLDDDGRLCVCCNDAGVEFVEATCPLIPFSRLALRNFQYSRLFWKLARRTHLLRSDYPDLPLLSVQVTRFSDGGGLAIGVSLSHAVADAQSFYDFMACWADTCRRAPMRFPPLHIRSALSFQTLFPGKDFYGDHDHDHDHVHVQHSATAPNLDCKTITLSSNDERSLEDSLLYMRNRANGIRAWLDRCERGRSQMLSGDKQLLHMESMSYGERFLSMIEEQREKEKLLSAMEEQQHKRGEKVFGEIVCGGGGGGKEAEGRKQAAIMEKQEAREEKREARKDLVQRVFWFSEEKVKRIKEEAGGKYTRFESFCAHWWRALIRARRDVSEGQAVCLLIPINCRSRFLGIPAHYFGNALDGALVRMSSAGELRRAELAELAAKIHAAIVSVTEDSFRQYIGEAEKRRNAIPHFDRTGLFHVVDSPKYPVYSTDFGWGAPAAVRAEGFRFGAEVQILDSPLGGYNLFCALDAPSMSALIRDPSFLPL